MNFNRVVIKVGSALISPDGKGCSGKYIQHIARFISECHKKNKEVILVSSGSVAAGRHLIQHRSIKPSIQTKQAMASVGQIQMMANWQKYIDVPCSQLLITHGDLKARDRYINIRNTLRVLLANKIIPIVNENDTVATEELKVGDNDNLAALVALVAEADTLLLVSDINGVYNKDPKIHHDAKILFDIPEITDEIHAMAGTTHNAIATGGMKTKIEAAEKAVDNGIDTYIVNGTNSQVFDDLLAGIKTGTHFFANKELSKAKKYWLKHTLKSNGSILIDNGAVNALKNTGASLLPSGILVINGQFLAGDSVDIVDEKEQVIAKGICQYNYQDLGRIKGKRTEDIQNILGFCLSKVIVHRDDMVVL
tara:strand:- start:102 stop:1196 length:1095 start_codon:yes stop_codon:yes gene_type:complete